MKRMIFCWLLVSGLGLVNCLKKQHHEIIYPTPPVFSVYGIVFDDHLQIPLDSVFVSIAVNDTILSATYTDEQGNFRIDSLYSEKYLAKDFKIKFLKDGYEIRHYDISVIKEDLDIGDIYLARSFILVGEYVPPGDNPSGIAWDGTNIWTCDEDEGKIYKHNDSMEVIEEYPDIISSPRAMTFADSILWVGNNDTYYVCALDKNFTKIDSVLIVFISMAALPSLDLTFKDNYLIACENISDQIKLYDINTKETTIFDTKTNLELLDPFGIVWAGNYFLLKYDRGFYKLDENMEKQVHLKTPFAGIRQITFDGINFYAISNTGYSPPKIFKFTNIW